MNINGCCFFSLFFFFFFFFLLFKMEFIFNSMPHFDRGQYVLSEWLAKLEQRFDLVVQTDIKKIRLCQIYIGQTGKDILSRLGENATWDGAKTTLLSRLGDGTRRYQILSTMASASPAILTLADVLSQPNPWNLHRFIFFNEQHHPFPYRECRNLKRIIKRFQSSKQNYKLWAIPTAYVRLCEKEQILLRDVLPATAEWMFDEESGRYVLSRRGRHLVIHECNCDPITITWTEEDFGDQLALNSKNQNLLSLHLDDGTQEEGAGSMLEQLSQLSSTNENSVVASGPAAEPGSASAPSSSAVDGTLPANQNSAAQGSVTPSTVKQTRYGQIVKPADSFSMMASQCPVPSSLSTLDVLGPSILPTTFSAVLFTGDDGVGRVLTRTKDLRRICEWLKGQGRVEINGQKQSGRQTLPPAARSGLRVLLPPDVEWLYHTDKDVYVCYHRGRPLELLGGNVSHEAAPSPSHPSVAVLNPSSNLPGHQHHVFQGAGNVPEGGQPLTITSTEEDFGDQLALNSENQNLSSLHLGDCTQEGGAGNMLEQLSQISSTNENAAAAALGPTAKPGPASASSSPAAAVTLSVNQNSAAQGSVTERGVYKAPSTVKQTSHGQIVKPADSFSMMASHCPVPSPLSTLDVLGSSLLPTTFSAVLFTGDDGGGRVLKRPRDLRRILEWLKGQGRVEINGQKQPGRQSLPPAARSGLRDLLPPDVEWLYHTGKEVYVCCRQGQPLEFCGGNMSHEEAPSPSRSSVAVPNPLSSLPGHLHHVFQVAGNVPGGGQPLTITCTEEDGGDQLALNSKNQILSSLHLGDGTQEGGTGNMLEQLSQGSHDIFNLGAKAERLSGNAYTGEATTAHSTRESSPQVEGPHSPASSIPDPVLCRTKSGGVSEAPTMHQALSKMASSFPATLTHTDVVDTQPNPWNLHSFVFFKEGGHHYIYKRPRDLKGIIRRGQGLNLKLCTFPSTSARYLQHGAKEVLRDALPATAEWMFNEESGKYYLSRRGRHLVFVGGNCDPPTITWAEEVGGDLPAGNSKNENLSSSPQVIK